MRGAILNFYQGLGNFTLDQFGSNYIPVGIQEATFWLWRVSAIRLDISVAPASGPHAPINISRTYAIPKNGVIDPTARTEFDQVLDRTGFSAVSEVGDPETFGLGFAGAIVPLNDDPFAMFAFFECYGATYSSNFLPGMVGTGVNVSFSGSDVITGGVYERSLAIFKSSGAPNLSGSVSVTPWAYYPWADPLGNALYDTSTGAKLPPPDDIFGLP